jgi:hypothetical protein
LELRAFRTIFRGSLLGLLVAAVFGVVAVAPAAAYGPANWQLGVAGTGVAPGTGFGFGFWGWCEFGGGVVSGHTGDCQISQYLHGTPLGDVNCEQSIDITSWDRSGGTFVLSGTSVTNPASAAPLCPIAGGVPPTFSNFNPGIPAAAGHYNFGTFDGLAGEFQLQLTQIQ